MILIGCFIAVLVAFGVGYIAKSLIRRICSVGVESFGPTFGYSFSALAFTITLAITPAFVLGFRNYGRPLALGMESGDAFGRMFLPFVAACLVYVSIAKYLEVQRNNVRTLFFLSAAISMVAAYLVTSSGAVHMGGIDGLLFWTTILCYLIIQIFVASIHHAYTRKPDAQPVAPGDAAR